MRILRLIDSVRLTLLLAVLMTDAIADVAAGDTFYIEDYCDGRMDHRLLVGGTGQNSTGVLKTSRTFYRPGMSCFVTLVTPPGHRLLANMWLLDLRSHLNGLCIDYLQVHAYHSAYDPETKLCGIELLGDEWDVFYTDSRTAEMKIEFHSAKDESTGERRGFQLSFTSFTDVIHGHCNDSRDYVCDNGWCIWNGLTCDGFDNCGDGSDEWTIGRAHCQLSYTTSTLVVMAVGVFVAVITLIFVMGLLARICYNRTVVVVRSPAIQATLDWDEEPGRGFVNPGYIAWFQEDASSSRKAKTRPLLIRTD